MPTTLTLKANSTNGVVPSAGQLSVGELAINTGDGKLFSKGANNTVFQVNAPAAATPAGSNTQVQFNDSGAVNALAGMVFNKVANNLTVSNTMLVGANVIINTERYFAGNSTVNATVNSTSMTVQNSTLSSIQTIGAQAVGNSTANSQMNTTTMVVQNSTASSLQTPGTMSVGNSTVNTSQNSTSYYVGNSTVAGQLTANVLTNIPVVGSINGTLFYLTFPGGTSQTAVLLEYVPFDCTLTAMRHRAGAGAVTTTVRKNGANIGGLISLTTNTTVQTPTATSNNTFVTGDNISVAFTAVANTDDDFHYVLFLTRTGF